MAIGLLLPPSTVPVGAETGDRTLYLYHTHTHETARITFKRNGVYDQKGLQQLDWFLRDWRNNQPTEMAPQLFDLVWEVYQKVGATQPINIVSAYRSPVTNAYLHSRSMGVAVHSQHMLGHAMDYFIPGVPLTKLRAVGMQQQVGGVGFYPNSGSPFVHMDVGTVRAWPRMTTAQLESIFPDGKTLHVPSDGHVLSNPGYAYAMAQWNACHAVPCTNPASLKGGAGSLGHDTMVAAATTSATGKTFTDIFRGINPGDPKTGTTADGIVGPGTIAALNRGTTAKVSRDDIIANMERWRWLPHDLGAFHVMVNIPEFRVAVVDNDDPVFTTRVVVGKPATPTPLFSNSIKNIVVNPYWNVPASIVAKEIKPHMLANPGYLASQNMQLVSGAHVLDASAIDWADVSQSNWKYLVRQLPGPSNSLGQIKFLFPNDHDVYLHDTPSKSLFGTAMRAYSHGCVRVQHPMDFANALLQDEPGLTVQQLEAMFGPTERWVTLKTHVPVHIAYFTVRVDADGTLHSFADVYGHNARLIALLNGKAAPVAPAKTPIVSGV